MAFQRARLDPAGRDGAPTIRIVTTDNEYWQRDGASAGDQDQWP
jgi:hypothetical protein